MPFGDHPRFAVIGGGKMGEAIVGGLIGAEEGLAAPFRAEDFTVADPGDERRARHAVPTGRGSRLPTS